MHCEDINEEGYVSARGEVNPKTVQRFWRLFSTYIDDVYIDSDDDPVYQWNADLIDEAENLSGYDLWGFYVNGIKQGIAIGFVERYSLTDMQQDPSVRKFGKKLLDQAEAGRSRAANAGFAAGNPQKMTSTPPSTRGSTMPATTNPAKRRLMR